MKNEWPPNKRLHPAVRGASLRSAPRPAGEAPAVRRMERELVMPLISYEERQR